MSLYFLRDKIKGVRRDCQQILHNPIVSVRVLPRLVGKPSSSIQAVFPDPLHYRFLLRAKNVALKETQSYESILSLDLADQQELLWWRDNLAAWNGKSLLNKKEDLLIKTDAKHLEWGATCCGVRTGGMWSRQEHQLPGTNGRRFCKIK